MARTHAEQILADLIEIPSVTDDREANNAALDYIETFLADIGMHVERRSYVEEIGGRPPIEYGALVATTTGSKTPEVMLSAHVDVVPGPAKLFKLRRQGDRLLGRGTADMKGAIANFLAVARDLRLDEYDFGITIVTNEEINGRGVENLLKDGFVPKAVVLPDNGKNWQLEKVSKGAWSLEVEAPGVSAHGSRPWDGDSASVKLIGFLSDLLPLFDGQGPETDTINPSRLQAGVAQNQVPDYAKATLDIRVMNVESRERIRERIDDLCRQHGLSYKVIANFPPLVHDLSSPYIQAFRNSVKAVLGREVGETISPGACDASYYDQRGIPTIVIQPTGGGEHADSEWVDRDSFSQFTKVLRHFLDSVCRVG